MKEQIMRDLQAGFVYYPSSGTDFELMKVILQRFDNRIQTFVYCDAGRPILESLKPFYDINKLDFIENKLGLNGFEVKNTLTLSSFSKNFDLEPICSWLIKRHGPNYESYISGIVDQHTTRYELLFEEKKVVLYFIKFEAVAVLKWLLEIGNLTRNTQSGFVLCQPGFGWTECKYEESLVNTYAMANYFPEFILTESHWWTDRFPIGENLKCGNNRILNLRLAQNN